MISATSLDSSPEITVRRRWVDLACPSTRQARLSETAKKELMIVKMERDILKKAAAYFAKESLPGTR